MFLLYQEQVQKCSERRDSHVNTAPEAPLEALYSQALADSPSIQGHTSSSTKQ